MASSVDTDHRYGSNLGCMKANEGCFSSIMIIKTPFVCPGILSEDKKYPFLNVFVLVLI